MSTYVDPPSPPFDRELMPALAGLPDIVTTLNAGDIAQLRVLQDASALDDAALSRGATIEVAHRVAPGSEGAPDVPLLVLRPSTGSGPWPIVYAVHGGGLVAGSYRDVHSYLLDLVEEALAVVVSVEYRLAPEHPHPAPVQDVYAGLSWVAAHAAELDGDADRLLVIGASAGGGLAAGAILMARDLDTPAIAHQMLVFPMLDDRMITASSQEIVGTGVWDGTANRTGWSALLGGAAGGADVSPYAAPARATDLIGLPPTYIDVGSAEVFRDEAIDYASRLAQAGCPVDLHVWAGSYHGADQLAPAAAVSRATLATRAGYLRRALAPSAD